MLCPICRDHIPVPSWKTCAKVSCGTEYQEQFRAERGDLVRVQQAMGERTRNIRRLQERVKQLRIELRALQFKYKTLMDNRPEYAIRGCASQQKLSTITELIANGTKPEHICEVLGMTSHKFKYILAPRCRRHG